MEDGSGKNGFRPWKRESSAAVGMGEREGVTMGVGEREREREEKCLGLRWEGFG